MRFLNLTFSAFSILAFSSVAPYAFAQDNYSGGYANIGISQLSADLDLNDLDLQGNAVDLGEETAKIVMINGRVGYRLNKYLAIEGDGGFGIGGDSFRRQVPVQVPPLGTVNVDVDADLDVKNYFGIFARGILQVDDQFDIFIRAGYGGAKTEAAAVGSTALLPGVTASIEESQSVDDIAYGIGAEYRINDRHGIRADFSAIGSEAQFVAMAYTINF